MSTVEKWIFDNYDINLDGKLSNGEAKEMMKDIESYDFTGEAIPVTELDQWFNTWDKNQDGQLSIQEFIKALA